VLGGLATDLQRFLAMTSILRPVDVDLALALYPEREGVLARQVEAWTMEAARAGLLTRRALDEPWYDYHPLLKEFLSIRLARSVDADERRAMNLRVARRAETRDWVVAGRHYVAAGEATEAIRVLVDNVASALGTGSWGPAMDLIRATNASEADPPHRRSAVSRGRLQQPPRRSGRSAGRRRPHIS
jgi:ATP/maltotriose-dependent transcriptional regulator MalT